MSIISHFLEVFISILVQIITIIIFCKYGIWILVRGSTIQSLEELPKNLKWFLEDSNSKESVGPGSIILELTGMAEDSKLLVYAIL